MKNFNLLVLSLLSLFLFASCDTLAGLIGNENNSDENWESASAETQTLIEFYKSTNGDSWTNNTNWCSKKPLNEWYGIKVDNSGAVTSIDLSNNNLTGDASVDFNDFSNLSHFNIDNNKMRGVSITGNDKITEFEFNNCATENISFENFKNVSITCDSLSSISGSCETLNVSNCDFGDHSTPFSVDVIDATIYNCKMHSCGLSSETLTFESSSTYDTWFCHTSKKLNIINSYCSTICSGDFNEDTIINLENATLWRSNWNEESKVTLTRTLRGSEWDSLWDF